MLSLFFYLWRLCEQLLVKKKFKNFRIAPKTVIHSLFIEFSSQFKSLTLFSLAFGVIFTQVHTLTKTKHTTIFYASSKKRFNATTSVQVFQ